MADTDKTVTMHHPDREPSEVEVPEWAVDAKLAMGWSKGKSSKSAGGDATSKEK